MYNQVVGTMVLTMAIESIVVSVIPKELETKKLLSPKDDKNVHQMISQIKHVLHKGELGDEEEDPNQLFNKME